MKAVVLEVKGLGKHDLRMTECGAIGLKNGDRVKVALPLLQGICDQYGAFVKVLGEAEEVSSLKRGHWEPVGPVGEPASPTAMGDSMAEFKSDKSMAGKSKVKKKG